MVVWDKLSPGMGQGWRTQHELVAFASRAALKFDGHKAQPNVISVKRTGNILHPTQKPVELITKILEVTDMARTICDPFAGSGTMLMACEQLGRKCFALDGDPGFCDVTVTRWQESTGAAATLEGTTRTFAQIATERLNKKGTNASASR